MNKNKHGLSDVNDEYLPLAQWLEQLLASKPEHATTSDDTSHNGDTYHLEFYRQLPDFVQTLLNKPTQEDIMRFGPLVFHLIECPTCHIAYIEMYDAMHVTIEIDEAHISTGPLPQTYATTSTRVLVNTCQLLINQAVEVLREARRNHNDHDAWARSLLQQAIYLSSHILESTQRQRARRNLVDAATFFIDTTSPAADSYLPALSAASGPRQSMITRRADTLGRPHGQAALYLQTGVSKKEGIVTLNQDVLELHLEDLHQELRGRFLLITIPFGSLLEPVRWIGGNPRAIRSKVPVAEDGSITTPLGTTNLQIDDPEDHNLLEAMFTKLDIRLAE